MRPPPWSRRRTRPSARASPGNCTTWSHTSCPPSPCRPERRGSPRGAPRSPQAAGCRPPVTAQASGRRPARRRPGGRPGPGRGAGHRGAAGQGGAHRAEPPARRAAARAGRRPGAQALPTLGGTGDAARCRPCRRRARGSHRRGRPAGPVPGVELRPVTASSTRRSPTSPGTPPGHRPGSCSATGPARWTSRWPTALPPRGP